MTHDRDRTPKARPILFDYDCWFDVNDDVLYIHAFFIHSFILICQSRELWLLLFSSSLSNLELLLDPSPLPLRSLAWKIHPAEGYIQLRYHPVIIYALMMHYSCSNDDEDNDTHNNNDDDVHVKTPFIHPSIHPLQWLPWGSHTYTNLLVGRCQSFWGWMGSYV